MRKLLRLETPEHVARATEHIDEMADAIAKLGDKGYTYSSDGSVYYRISSFPDMASFRTTISAA